MYYKQHHDEFPNFREVPKTGVIYVMAEARKHGFHYGNENWANLGQGAPETGALEGGPERLDNIPLSISTHEYGPVGGIQQLREAVAELYNRRYRRGMGSKYSAENVAISAGGRIGLTRIAAALSAVNLGHFLPDYTAYEELLDLFRDFVPIPILLDPEEGFVFHDDTLRKEIVGMGLGAVLMSNPCNPTGQVVAGETLQAWVDTARDLQCMMIFDEFYAHYVYDDVASNGGTLSAAAYVKDVNHDPVVLVDGFTKNWRYPGLRLSWTVGPRKIIDHIISAGSFLDGGAPHAIQKVAIPLLEQDLADAEAKSIQEHFSHKREILLERISKLGMSPVAQPNGSFYCFASLKKLPDPLRNCMNFFNEAIKRRVICVPGLFFDVNPGKRRSHIPSRLENYVRLSYGPPMDELTRGLDRFEAMIKSYV